MEHAMVAPDPGTGPQPAGAAPLTPRDFGVIIEDLNARMEHALSAGNTAACLELIETLEAAKASLSAIQARAAYMVEEQTIIEHRQAGIHLKQLHRGAASMVALSRRKPQQGSRVYLEAVRALQEDMPYLASRFSAGEVSEEQVLAIVTPLLDGSNDDRESLDREYRRHPDMFDGLGTQQSTDLARKHVDRVHGEERTTGLQDADQDRYLRCVQEDKCVRVYGRLPLPEGLALKRRLERDTQRELQCGDRRTRDQLMCDLFLGAVTGSGDDPVPLSLDLQLVMTERALFLGDDEPAFLPGYGVIPAQYARRLLASPNNIMDPENWRYGQAMAYRMKATVFLQRLFTAPGNQDLVAMDSRKRLFPEDMKAFIADRDVYCRTPYCNNRASQADHVVQAALGGPTTVVNGSWRCRSCNLSKESGGWREMIEDLLPHTIQVEPVPGVRYHSKAPPVIGIARRHGPALNPQASWIGQLGQPFAEAG